MDSDLTPVEKIRIFIGFLEYLRDKTRSNIKAQEKYAEDLEKEIKEHKESLKSMQATEPTEPNP